MSYHLRDERLLEERKSDGRTYETRAFLGHGHAGMLASQNPDSHGDRRVGEVVQWARAYADALIAELMREQVAGGQ
jgi:hypothetical protein